jgi:two-component system OmpR family response regulator
MDTLINIDDSIATTILVVDDEADIREPLCEHLSINGFTALGAANAEQAYKVLAEHNIHLVVLDVMMPVESGLDVCRTLAKTSEVPVILLTALTDDIDRIVGLEIGADDYINKPFNPRELIARIRSVLRRTNSSRNTGQRDAAIGDFDTFGHWRLNNNLAELHSRDNTVVMLSTGEFKLLRVFIENPNKILSRDDLISLTQGRDSFPYERSIDNMISRLRRKIEADQAKPIYIQTVWGGGYKFYPKNEPQGK